MKKQISIVVSALLVLAATQAYAQKNELAKRSLQALTGQVPSAFSHSAALSVRSASMLGARIAQAEFALKNKNYVTAAELFAGEAPRLAHLSSPQMRHLSKAFTALDDIHGAKTSSIELLHSYGIPSDILADTTIKLMANILDVQNYMLAHNNEFPQLFTPMENGWKSTAAGLDTKEGNYAFWNVLGILISEQEGKASPVIVEQLVALRHNASNRVSVDALIKSLQEWRAAGVSPTLPTAIDNVSLWQEAEKLWLVTEIRLLQLTPGIELPEVLKNAQVTYK